MSTFPAILAQVWALRPRPSEPYSMQSICGPLATAMGCNRLFSVPPASPKLLKLRLFWHSNPWGQPSLFSIFQRIFVRLNFLWLRRGCVWFRTCFRVQPINPLDVSAWDEMAVGVHCDLNGAVSHLIFHVSQGSPALYQQRTTRVAKVVDSEPS